MKQGLSELDERQCVSREQWEQALKRFRSRLAVAQIPPHENIFAPYAPLFRQIQQQRDFSRHLQSTGWLAEEVW